ncbi:RNA polymerase sigma factor [Geothrix sp. PMB-07]|uniref:RNA polymerase sigma factor n=1 Tax=Geothrix sp. PMB-07 TaxID=3068640 RepID=UPI002741B79C|nr:sigma-70 family RNA polymerase sigma factor [Geothrix sp. PMB-07]WLT30774.1 sigma-70 family RNA polymerase sigma factor [Geothrix sp. PMB-07]
MTPDAPATAAARPEGLGPAAPARTAILSRIRERIVAFAASRGAGAHAEDLAQEVLVLIHEKYGHLDRLEDLLPLAFQILRFKLAAHRRKAARRGEYDAVDVDVCPPASDAPDPATVLERKELLAKLMGGIAAMGERCRELFRLKLQGRTFPEIQSLLGAASLNTVYTWDHRCRKQLLETLGGTWAGTGGRGET